MTEWLAQRLKSIASPGAKIADWGALNTGPRLLAFIRQQSFKIKVCHY